MAGKARTGCFGRLFPRRDALGAALDLQDAHSIARLAEEFTKSLPELGALGTAVAGIAPQLASAGVGPNQLCAVLCLPIFWFLRKRTLADEDKSDVEAQTLQEKLDEILDALKANKGDKDTRLNRVEEQVATLYTVLDKYATKENVGNEIGKLMAELRTQQRTLSGARDLLLGLAQTTFDPTQGPTVQSFFATLHSQLEGLRQDVSDVHSDVRAIGAPPLHVPEPDRDPNPYRYRDQAVPLVGRQTEQGYLQKFLVDPMGAAWMLVTGGAGSGKSRIGLWAVEEAQRLGYRAGFLKADGQFEGWGAWKVRQDTLIVVDYALRRTGDLGLAVQALGQSCNGHRVRVLLLERDAVGDWYTSLNRVQALRYDPVGDPGRRFEWLELGTMQRRGVESLFAEMLKRKAVPGHTAQTLAEGFLAIEPKGRPLFAAFYFGAVGEGQEVQGWSSTDLARWVLDHELSERWRPARVDGPHGHLAAVACAVRAGEGTYKGQKGVVQEESQNVRCLDGLLPHDWIRDQCAAIGSLGGGFVEAGCFLPALDPDSLAELYVLDRLAGKANLSQAVGEAEATRKVLDCLWTETAFQDALGEFVVRAVRSFPQHSQCHALTELPGGVPNEVRERVEGLVTAARLSGGASLVQAVAAEGADLVTAARKLPQASLAAVAQALFGQTFDRETTEEGRQALAELRALAEAHPDEAEVRLELARALNNAVLRLEDDGERQKFLAELRALAEAHTGEAEVRLELAKALNNAVGRLEDDGGRQEFLAELRALAEAHPGEAEVRLRLAQALTNAVSRLEDDGERQKFLAELRALAEAHLGEAEVRLRLAGALNNAVVRLEDDGGRQRFLAELRALAEAHPGEAEVRLRLAGALTNAVGRLEDDGGRKECLAELRALAEAHPGEAEVRLELAKALNNAVGRVEDDGGRQKFLAELRALAAAHPGEAEVRLELANAYFNATVGRETTEEGRQALAELRALAEAHPGEAEVRLRLARALNNAVLRLEDDGERQKFLAELRALAAAHPGEAEVRLELAGALTNAVGRLEDDGERQKFLAELRALAEAHPGEAEVRLELAKALNNAVGRVEDDGGRQKFLAELRALAAAHPGEAEVRLELAGALTNAVGRLEDDGGRQECLAELRALAAAHPGEAEVRLQLAQALTNAVSRLEDDGGRQEFLAELRALAGAHPGEAEVRLALAKALCNMAIHRLNAPAGRWGAEPFVAEARALLEGNEADPAWVKVAAFLRNV